MTIQTELEVQMRDITQLIPRANNPRTHSTAQIDQVAASIREFGWTNPILVGSDDDIIAGHARLAAARQLGMCQVPVIVLGGLSEAQRRALVIADNKLALNSGWDEELLRLELGALQQVDFDLSLTGFDELELERLLAGFEGSAEAAEEVPDVPAVTISRPGDLWCLGERHRVLCADATEPASVARLLGVSTPFLMVTDPPYGVSLDPEWREMVGLNAQTRQAGKVTNDHRVDWSAAYRLFEGDVAYVWHAGIHAAEVATNLSACGFQIRAQIIWKKQHFAISRGAYHWAHEPCWYAVRHGKTSHWCGDRTQSTLWEIANLNPFGGQTDPADEATGHGTQKPVELMRRPLLNHTRPGEIVYDPFLGSGTTLLAAQQTGRVCYAIDLDPRYVDVSILRWRKFTGQEPVLEGDGRTFERVAEQRLKDGECG